MRYNNFLLVCLCGLSISQKVSAQARISFGPGLLDITEGARTLPMPGGGGFNSPQFSSGDIDGDGVAELFVFDREADRASVFKRVAPGPEGWAPAPDLEAILPRMHNWALLRDYNRDGRADIFTSNVGAVRLYKNELQPDGTPGYNLAIDQLESTSLAGGPLSLFVLTSDIPGILDADGDGDLDIITFENFGPSVELHKNTSMELTGGFEQVKFEKTTCWGRFAKQMHACNQHIFGISCRVGVPDDSLPSPRPVSVNHIGSVITPLDADGDGDLDALISDVECTDLNLITNTAGAGRPVVMGSSNPVFPDGTRPISFQLFPAAYLPDLDGDQVPDLVASSNVYSNSADQQVTFKKSAWAYQNTAATATAAPQYQFRTQAYLQEDMVDLGTNTSTAWIDLDADGDRDLIAGSEEVANAQGVQGAALRWYRRTGRASVSLADTNLLQLGERVLGQAYPIAADFTGDGREDLGYLVNTSAFAAVLVYIPGTASAGPDGLALNLARQDTIRFAFRPGDAPTFRDLNNDNLPDMLLGRNSGILILALNTGTLGNPRFDSPISGYLGYSTSGGATYTLKPTIADFDNNGQTDLLICTGSHAPRLYLNPVFTPGYTAVPDTLIYQNQSLGKYMALPPSRWMQASAENLDGDNLPDLLLGTSAGGLVAMQNRLATPLSAKRRRRAGTIATQLVNPSTELTLTLAQAAQIEVLSLDGRLLYQAAGHLAENRLTQTTTLLAGLYQVRLTSTTNMQTLKWSKQ